MSDPYERDIELANAAKDFLSSPLARHIFDRAAEVVDQCRQALTECDPEDVKEIRRLQEEIRRQNGLGMWITEILHTGEQAKQVTADQEG